MADNYGTVAGFLTWAADRAKTYAADDTAILAALVRASEYVDAAYMAQWQGFKTNGRSQVRQWPRAGAADREGLTLSSDTVPVEVENATYEGADREIVAPGALAADIKPGGGIIRRVKAGSTEVEYAADTANTTTFTRIDQALSPLIGGTSSYSGNTARA
jgi:hypothetical protein